jgi:RNA polymerase sigma-70 factor (ECF subfamily)
MDAALYMDDFSTTEEPLAKLASASAVERLETLVDEQYDFVWRSVRRLGVREGDADDAAQQVFLVAARKLDVIRNGCERSFLYQTALRVASDYRRATKRRVESSLSDAPEVSDRNDPVPSTDELLDLRRARELLDTVLDAMSIELRAVFVLHELEQSTMADIANVLNLPTGTVASRLRRARTQFFELLERHQEPKRATTGTLS